MPERRRHGDGDAKFRIDTGASTVVVREVFIGKSSNGFTAKVFDAGKAVARTSQGYYDVETEGKWSGLGGREFKSKGVDRVYVKDGLPIRANVLKFKTECTG